MGIKANEDTSPAAAGAATKRRYQYRDRVQQSRQDATKDAVDDFNDNNMGTGSFSFDSTDDPCTREENGDMSFCMSNYARDAMKMMFMMRSHHMLTDVVLEVNDELFYAHKVVLSAGSPYFKAMFTGGLKECEMSRVRLQGVCPTAMGRILYFMYSGHIRITEVTVCQLLPAATMFQVPNVIDACCAFLERQLDPTNAIGIASFAEQHGCTKLKQRANQFIERHFTQICLEEEFLQLSAIQLIQLIRKDELNVQEEREVYNAVIKWVKYDEDSRYPKMEHILYAVRCQFLTPNFLKEQMSNCAVLKKVPACREYLERIFKDLTLHKRSVVPERKPNATRMIFISGGYFRHSLDILEAFNVDDQTWTSLPTLRVPRSGLGAAFLKGQFYAVGGRNNSPGSSYDSDWVDRYNPLTEEWRPCAPMSLPRNRVGVAVMDELLYAVGGSAGSEYHNSVEHYEPERDRWSRVRPMHYRRLGVGIAVVNRLLYAIGGFDGRNRLKTCECYHPENNEWTIIPPMAVGRSGAGVAALNQYIYVVGGFDGTRQLSMVERYDTELGVWDRVASIDIARSALSLTVLDGKLYAMGGFDGHNFLSIVEVYDPETNTWVEGTSLTTGRSGHASAVIYQPSSITAYMDAQETTKESNERVSESTNPDRATRRDSGSGQSLGSACSTTMHTLTGNRCHICNHDTSDTGPEKNYSTPSSSTASPEARSTMPPPRSIPPQHTRPPAQPSLTFVAPLHPPTIPSSQSATRHSSILAPSSLGPSLNFPSRRNSLTPNDKKRMRANSIHSIHTEPPIPSEHEVPMTSRIDMDDPKKFRRLYSDEASVRLNEGASTSSGSSSSSSLNNPTVDIPPDRCPFPKSQTMPVLNPHRGSRHCNEPCAVTTLKNNLQRRFREFVSGRRDPGAAEDAARQNQSNPKNPSDPNQPLNPPGPDDQMDSS